VNEKIVYVGLDVDDTQYQESALNTKSGEFISYATAKRASGYPIILTDPMLG
jgi:hypothetical protein